jgi:hypothetical protein
VRHSQNKKIWAQRVHRLGPTPVDSLVILVDPSEIDANQQYDFNIELCIAGDDLQEWSINWGFVQYCINTHGVMPNQAAKRSLLLNCTFNLKGWAFAFAANLSLTEREWYTSLITVSHAYHALSLSLICLVGSWRSCCRGCWTYRHNPCGS